MKRIVQTTIAGPSFAPRGVSGMRAEPLRHLEHIVGEHMIRNMADMPHRFRNTQRKMNQGLLAAAYALRHRNANRLHRALKTIHALRMENAEFRTRLSEG